MALGKEIGNFSLKITSTGFHEGDVFVNCDGTADNFGTVLGTMTFVGGDPNAQNGALKWRGNSFPDNGEALNAVGEGSFEALDNHRWRTRLVITTSDGQIFASDGVLVLKDRAITGKTLEWT